MDHPPGCLIGQIAAICCSYQPVYEYVLGHLLIPFQKIATHWSFEYKEHMQVVMGVECLAGIAQVFRAVCAPEPLSLDRGHTSITKCREMDK